MGELPSAARTGPGFIPAPGPPAARPPAQAPEVLLGKRYDEKADVFSFALCLYNLFSR